MITRQPGAQDDAGRHDDRFRISGGECPEFRARAVHEAGGLHVFPGTELKVQSPARSGSHPDRGCRPERLCPTSKALSYSVRDRRSNSPEVVPAGKAEMDGVSFINGFSPVPGESVI